MKFEKKLTFVESKTIVKEDKSYFKVVFKDENGEYIESLVKEKPNFVVEKSYFCTFNYFKSKKYVIYFNLQGVRS